MKEQHGPIQDKSDPQANGARGQHSSRFGNYELIRRIDVGGMGEVYLARQLTAFGREVAIKIMRSDLVHDPIARKRFLREAEVSAHLLHEHILTLIEFSEEDGRLFLVTPYIKGGTLAQRIRRGPLTLGEVYQLFKALVQAIAYVHKRGVIHRDLKPSNILLDSEDGSDEIYVRLIDFGIAATSDKHDSSALTLPGQELGTAAYMAPERLNGITAPSNDIYSLGVILHEMVTGKLPAVSDRAIALPQSLGSIIRCCTAVNPDERFGSAEELLIAFEQAYAAMRNKSPQLRQPSSSSPSLPPLEKKSTSSGRLAAVKADQAGTLNEVLVHRGEFVLSPLSNQERTFKREDYEAPTTYVDPAEVAQSQASLSDAASVPSRSPKHGKRRKRSFLGIVTAVIIAILFIIASMTYLAFQASIAANVVVSPRVQIVSGVLALSANPKLQSVDASTSSLPAIELSSARTATRSSATTGQTGCFFGLGTCQQSVAIQDVENLLRQVRPAAKTSVQQDLQRQAHDNLCSIVGNITYAGELQGLSVNPLPGTISSTVTVSQAERGSVECVKTQDVRALAHTLLQRQAPQNYVLMDQTIQVGQFVVKSVGFDGVVQLSVPAAGVASYQISDQELATIRTHISGMTPKAARAYIATLPGLDTNSISVRLTFGDTAPTNAQQIHVTKASPTNLPFVQLPKPT